MAKLNGKDIFFSPRIIIPADVDEHYDPTSDNAQSGKAVAEAVADKQDTLISGTNIKTINGESVLGSGNIDTEPDLSDYVKNTDYATSTTAGIIKTGISHGLSVSSGGFERVVPATNAAIDSRTPADIPRNNTTAGTETNQFRNPITPSNIDYAVKKVLTDNKTTFTDTEQNTAKNKLGISEVKIVYGKAGVTYELTANTFYKFYSKNVGDFDKIRLSISPDFNLFNTCVFWQPLNGTPEIEVIGEVENPAIWSGDDVTNGRFSPQGNTGYKIEFFTQIGAYCYARVTKLT